VNAAFTVLLGTLFPLIMDALQVGKISVGPPYFQSVFVPLMLPVLILIGFMPHIRWKRGDAREALRRLWRLMVISVFMAAALLWIFMGKTGFMTMLGLGLALWVMLTTVKGMWLRIADKPGRWQALWRLPRGFYGMTLAHFGLGVFVIGVTLTSSYSIEQDIRMVPDKTVTVAGYQFRFQGIERLPGANYTAERGTLSVMRDGKMLTTLHPEKRVYKVQQSGMTEAAIDAGLFRDLYVAMGEPMEGGAWSIRIQYKPFVRWIWLGCLFMFVGGLVAISDRRYRVLARQQRSLPGNVALAEGGA
jgi:cytochrome c-type biogenesis protein CcmF